MSNSFAETNIVPTYSSKMSRKTGRKMKNNEDPEWTPQLTSSENTKRARVSNPGELKRTRIESEKENVQKSAEKIPNNRREKHGVEETVTSSIETNKVGRQAQGNSSKKIRQNYYEPTTTNGGSNIVTDALPKINDKVPAQSSSKEESTFFWTSPYQETLKKAKPSLEYLHKTGKPFIQDGPCYMIDPQRELPYCRECPPKEGSSIEGMVCRFFAFRLIRYSLGKLQVAGFSDPYRDVSQEDLALWIPSLSGVVPSAESQCLSRRILHFVGDQFCYLLHREKKALTLDISRGVSRNSWDIFWKRAIGVREACDVCLTSLFNYHWTCHLCGFVVCIDCYEERMTPTIQPSKDLIADKDNYMWALCHNGRIHHQKNLMLTQIIAGDSLIQLDEQYHKVRKAVSQGCLCQSSVKDQNVIHENASNNRNASSSESTTNAIVRNSHEPSPGKANINSAPHIYAFLMETTMSWLCNGRLLWLKNAAEHFVARSAFQLHWEDGLPVIVSGVTRDLDCNLWNSEAFSRELGDVVTDIVDCMTGLTISGQPMRKFWDGFNDVSKRLLDESGSPMILKLKDWPPGDDFAKVLPTRFENLMKALPLSEYTHRASLLNLVSWLPEVFVRPDLGPKMYTAYGSACRPEAGTTNLHIDMSDAVNLLVYVGLPTDGTMEACKEEVLKVIRESGCDEITQARIRLEGVLPGALWHIFKVSDACSIRSLLNRVAVENEKELDPKGDPIHDQSWYLDANLRNRLYNEYGVEGFTIVQCLGDAVFIPAGAPHQVLNLHNCIKVAEDFVSPENITQCFQLTKEFRNLSDEHRNHEDLLQVKSILYHAVKGAVSSLCHLLGN